ncbi:PepSY domain-containing protein [Gluconacetobacter sp. 1b LMG 1731]|uniref:PepSY domain-containing protein n=1 Tax=Gluconacetobacter dulcium TaxID=2729096 RepID=A0A7W4IMX0_9PROT|nr:PepSY-associated TM helix domain-containing protein [Gluconacetobacter dulcium]MBB2165849.1 PepSY domain-containing protein [Gluconacetobacter dulcium]MBB2195025.1 PepSY domain-containing protein [Gluconacetobacter dulcium]
MTNTTLRRWFVFHKWVSLICTLFLLVVCVTGLPILFAEEIFDRFVDEDDPPYEVLSPGTPNANLDVIMAKARAMYPGQIVTNVAPDDDEPAVLVSMAPSWQALKDDKNHPDRRSGHWIKFDARTAKVVKQSRPADMPRSRRWVDLLLSTAIALHINLFAGLPGALFVGLMGLLFVASLISGMVLYGRFMKRLPFGAVRRGRAARLTWLDLHNLLGAATLVWATVVGFTGVVNELQTPLFGLWRVTDVRQILRPYAKLPVPSQDHLSSVQAAFDTAAKAAPGNEVTGLSFPGASFGSPVHYVLWTRGATPLRARMFTPVLVDARTGELTGAYPMPWYLRFLEISRPLHFGDYGGMPLKILWALLDLVVIAVLVSGVVLWAGKRKIGTDARLRALGFDLDAERVSASSPCSAAEGR